uniref:Alkaline ceramidase n=1 Tax=Clastoptera arizonana TaxID=38151 RepID=A0A1B6DAA4_9HEMI
MAPTEKLGYWGVPTSTIDWCENNYEVNYYVAEMWNTVSNLMMILPSLWGMFEVLRKGFDRRFVFCNFLLLVVGIGSWAFHMTLLYRMQLFDELPMVYGTCVHVYCLYEIQNPRRTHSYNLIIIGILTTYAIGFTTVYLLCPQPLIQHTSYGILVIISFYFEYSIIREEKCKTCQKLFLMSVPTYLFGFLLWNIDKLFCTNLTLLRRNLPKALSPVTQLHAWWHIFAGYGTYVQILFCIHSRHDFRKKKNDLYDLEVLPFASSLRWVQKLKTQ